MIMDRAAMAMSEDEDEDDENDIFRLMPASLGFLRDQDLAAFCASDEMVDEASQYPAAHAMEETRPIKQTVDLVLEKRRVTANIPPPRSKTGLMDVAEFWAHEDSNDAEEGNHSSLSRLARIRSKKNEGHGVLLADVAEFWDREESKEAKDINLTRLSRVRTNKGSRQIKHSLDLSFMTPPVSKTVDVDDDGREVDERSLGKCAEVVKAGSNENACSPVYEADEFESVDVVVDAVVDAVDAANDCGSPLFEAEDFESPLIPKIDFSSFSRRSKERYFDIRSRLADLPEFNDAAPEPCVPIQGLASETRAQQITSASPTQERTEGHETSASPPQETIERHETSASPPRETMEEHEPSASPRQETMEEHETSASPPQETMEEHETSASPPQETMEEHETSASPPQETMEERETSASPPQEAMEPQTTCDDLPSEMKKQHDAGSDLWDTSESLASETLEGSICNEQTDVHETKPRPGKPRRKIKRKREVKADVEKSPWVEESGTEWKNGRRCSTRYRTRPLEYWRGEKLLYGRVHKTMPTLIGIKHSSPLPPHPKRGEKPKEFKVESFVPDQFKHLVKLAAL